MVGALAPAGRTLTPRSAMPGDLRPLVKQIMDSRITVSSGGPIGYLEPTAPP